MPENAARSLGRMFHLISGAIEAEKDHLSELDGVIGDADHGITMSIGFMAVNATLARLDMETSTPAAVLSIAASAFLNAVGASTGPLYATGLQRASQTLADSPDLGPANQAAMIAAIARGIRDRGKSQRGDKTMLDAWLPAAEAAQAAIDTGSGVTAMWQQTIAAADSGACSTRSMIAAKGRAARVGARSLGHIDPGAASAVIILRAMGRTFCPQQATMRVVSSVS